jgi:hypothetical protein
MVIKNRRRWGRIVGVAMLVALLDSPVMADQNKAESRRGMGDMQAMSQMMAECQKHQQAMMNSIDQMTKMMQEAKQSSNPTKIRDALDQSQRSLTDMKDRMTMCTGMMQNMSGGMGAQMGGMMQGGSGGQMPGMMSEKQDQKTGQKASSMMGARGTSGMEDSCPMCIAEMILLGLLIVAAIAALIALTIFLIRRSRVGNAATAQRQE